jgi:hypothetical protein
MEVAKSSRPSSMSEEAVVPRVLFCLPIIPIQSNARCFASMMTVLKLTKSRIRAFGYAASMMLDVFFEHDVKSWGCKMFGPLPTDDRTPNWEDGIGTCCQVSFFIQLVLLIVSNACDRGRFCFLATLKIRTIETACRTNLSPNETLGN